MNWKTCSCLALALSFAFTSNAVKAQDVAKPELSFFVTSSTHSGNLGGLEGADAICQSLAEKAGAGHREWRAYLSTTEPERLQKFMPVIGLAMAPGTMQKAS